MFNPYASENKQSVRSEVGDPLPTLRIGQQLCVAIGPQPLPRRHVKISWAVC
jgi:hypothetical protein